MADPKERNPFPFLAMFVCGLIGIMIAFSATKSVGLTMVIGFLATASPGFVYMLNTKSGERPMGYVGSLLGLSWWFFLAAMVVAMLLHTLSK